MMNMHYAHNGDVEEELLGSMRLRTDRTIEFIRSIRHGYTCFVLRTRMSDGRVYDHRCPKGCVSHLRRALDQFERRCAEDVRDHTLDRERSDDERDERGQERDAPAIYRGRPRGRVAP